jgi:hypothetical protein
MVGTYFKLLLQIFLEKLRKTLKNSKIGIPTDIQTPYLLNKSQKSYCLSQPALFSKLWLWRMSFEL